jgi:hypothetical protein
MSGGGWERDDWLSDHLSDAAAYQGSRAGLAWSFGRESRNGSAAPAKGIHADAATATGAREKVIRGHGEPSTCRITRSVDGRLGPAQPRLDARPVSVASSTGEHGQAVAGSPRRSSQLPGARGVPLETAHVGHTTASLARRPGPRTAGWVLAEAAVSHPALRPHCCLVSRRERSPQSRRRCSSRRRR